MFVYTCCGAFWSIILRPFLRSLFGSYCCDGSSAIDVDEKMIFPPKKTAMFGQSPAGLSVFFMYGFELHIFRWFVDFSGLDFLGFFDRYSSIVKLFLRKIRRDKLKSVVVFIRERTLATCPPTQIKVGRSFYS